MIAANLVEERFGVVFGCRAFALLAIAQLSFPPFPHSQNNQQRAT